MNTQQANRVPFQYSALGRLVKAFLHTKLGAKIGFFLGLSGFNRIEAIITRRDGTRELIYSYNSRVDAGAALNASLISGSTLGGITSPGAAKYIALSTSTLTPAKGDTTLTGETAATGLARALGTAGTYTAPSTLDGAASYVLSNTFTNNSAGSVTILSSAIFDAASVGNMFVEGNLSTSAVLAIGDQLTVNWTVNL